MQERYLADVRLSNEQRAAAARIIEWKFADDPDQVIELCDMLDVPASVLQAIA